MRLRVAHWSLAAALLLGASPAWADFRMDKSLPLAPGGTFTLETEVGAVTVIGDSPSNVVVTITSGRDDLQHRMDLQFDAQAGAVRVRATRRSHLVADLLGNWGWNDRVRFEVHVPRRTGVAVQTSGGSVVVKALEGGTRIRTSGGMLRLENIAGDVDARTSGGRIQVQDVRGGVQVSTSGGSIHVASVGGQIEAATSGGSINVDQAGGRVEARTSGGPILVRFAPGNSHGGSLRTSGGSVQAVIDPGATVSIDAATTGGRVSSDLAVRTWEKPARYVLRGDLNGGGPTLQVRTSGGAVRISGLGR